MIIVEGSDDSGKSTLIKQITENVQGLKFGGHSSGPPEGRDDYMDRLKVLKSNPGHTRNLIFDRFFFSELVYGPLLRGIIMPSDGDIAWIEVKLIEHDPLIIYCRRPPHEIAKLKDSDHLPGVAKNISKIVQAYDKIFSTRVLSLGDRLMVYDYNGTGLMGLSLNDICSRIKRYLRQEVTP